jgi:uncharacterized protein YjbI with pentapeptide repeats
MQHLELALGSNQKALTGAFFLGKDDVLDDTFTDVEFCFVRLSGGSLGTSRFDNCTFENVTFENVGLDRVAFHGCHFKNFTMLDCSRDAMQMEGCTGSPPAILDVADRYSPG